MCGAIKIIKYNALRLKACSLLLLHYFFISLKNFYFLNFPLYRLFLLKYNIKENKEFTEI